MLLANLGPIYDQAANVDAAVTVMMFAFSAPVTTVAACYGAYLVIRKSLRWWRSSLG